MCNVCTDAFQPTRAYHALTSVLRDSNSNWYFIALKLPLTEVDSKKQQHETVNYYRKNIHQTMVYAEFYHGSMF